MIRRFDTLASTSTVMAADADELSHGDIYITRSQTAGRGQRGNSWEAAPGKNLTFSLLLRPRTIVPAEAFAISMVTSLSIADAIENITGREIRIKWPNDIYAGDRKICGILIENVFGERIDRSVVGIGINVNQDSFESDAPNPVSMKQLTGRDYDTEAVLAEVTGHIMADFDAYGSSPDIASLTARYRARQWRGSGIHRWRDNITGETVEAAIASIAPDGILTLATVPQRSYAFKQISAIL